MIFPVCALSNIDAATSYQPRATSTGRQVLGLVSLLIASHCPANGEKRKAKSAAKFFDINYVAYKSHGLNYLHAKCGLSC